MITGEKTRLRKKKLSDARRDFAWQTDPELAELDAAPRLNASFPTYVIDYTFEILDKSPASQRFSVDTLDGRHIGNCVCYNINEAGGEAEVGIMIGDRAYWNRGYGTDAMTALVNHIFQTTGLNRLYLKSLHWNQRAHRCFRKCGFKPCGEMQRDGYSFLMMELYRQEWAVRQRKNDG